METTKTTIGKRFELIAKHYDMSKTKFSRIIDATQPSIRAIILGKSNPSFETLEKLLNTLPINAEWLMLGTGPMIRNYNEMSMNKDDNINIGEAVKILKYRLNEIENAMASSPDAEYKK